MEGSTQTSASGKGWCRSMWILAAGAELGRGFEFGGPLPGSSCPHAASVTNEVIETKHIETYPPLLACCLQEPVAYY